VVWRGRSRARFGFAQASGRGLGGVRIRALGACPGLKPRADKKSLLKPAGATQGWRLGM